MMHFRLRKLLEENPSAGKDGTTEQILNGYQVTRNGKTIRVEVEISNSFLVDRIKKEIKKSV